MVIRVPVEPGDKSSSRNWGDGASGEPASLEKAMKDQRTQPAGYHALKSNPQVSEGQAVIVKPCRWNKLDANS